MIRPMVMEDVPQIAALEAALFADPWNEKQLRDTIHFHPEDVYVYEVDGIVGYLLLMGAADEGELLRIGVDKDHRRQGIGLALMERMAQWAKEHGVATGYLEVRAHNEAAIALYERQGYVSLGVRKNYYKNPVEDAIIMSKGYADDGM